MANRKPTKKQLGYDEWCEISKVVEGLHNIHRLAMSSIQTQDQGETTMYMVAIRELSEKHGVSLDKALSRISGDAGVGCFDNPKHVGTEVAYG